MPNPRPSRDQVLRWLAADPQRTAGDAARKFDVPEGTVRSWKKRARDEGRAPRDNLTVLQPATAGEDLAALAELANLPPKELARLAIVIRLARLALRVEPDAESIADSARIVASLADRLGAIEGLDPVKEQDPTSEEGRKALREALKGIPRDLLQEVLAS